MWRGMGSDLATALILGQVMGGGLGGRRGGFGGGGFTSGGLRRRLLWRGRQLRRGRGVGIVVRRRA